LPFSSKGDERYLKVSKKPFQIECRAIDFEHSCRYKEQGEPPHPDVFLKCINQIVKATEGLGFISMIKSPSNSYQMDPDFDNAWRASVEATGMWNEIPFDAKALQEIPDIKPDFLLSNGSVVLSVEIEKSNEKTIWFDLMKLMMLINGGIVQFGLIIAPRNYAHRTGVWHPFDRARFYKYCLYKYANVHIDLIKSIAILGYTQVAKVSNSWTELSKDAVIRIKREAEKYFSA